MLRPHTGRRAPRVCLGAPAVPLLLIEVNLFLRQRRGQSLRLLLETLSGTAAMLASGCAHGYALHVHARVLGDILSD